MRNHLIAISLWLMYASSPSSDLVRLSLEAASKRWFFWLLISGGVVALGCILEIPETRFSVLQWWRQKRGRPLKEENPTSWRVPAASIGLLLVIVGVVGEVVFEGLASNADALLRTHESDVLSQAETGAAQANKLAQAANERAAKDECVTASIKAANLKLGIDLQGQEQETADAEKSVAGLQKDAADAKAAQQTVETQLSVQQEKTAKAEKELAELQARIQWRTVTEQQETNFVALTAGFLKGPLIVTSIDNDPESLIFAAELAAMFRKAGWNPTVNSMTPVGSTPIGLILEVKSKALVDSLEPLYHAARLEDALNRVGIPNFTNEVPELPDGTVVVFVGHKPPAP